MIDDETFRHAVAEDVKGRLGDRLRDYVRHPDNAEARRVALEDLVRNVDAQIERFEAQDASFLAEVAGDTNRFAAAEAEILTRRRGITIFRSSLVLAIAEMDLADADAAAAIPAVLPVDEGVSFSTPPNGPGRRTRSSWAPRLDAARAHPGVWCRIDKAFAKSTAVQTASDLANAHRRRPEHLKVRGLRPGEHWSTEWRAVADEPNAAHLWIRFDGTPGQAAA